MTYDRIQTYSKDMDVYRVTQWLDPERLIPTTRHGAVPVTSWFAWHRELLGFEDTVVMKSPRDPNLIGLFRIGYAPSRNWRDEQNGRRLQDLRDMRKKFADAY